MAITIWSGVTLGAVYVIVATGFTVSLLPSGVFNFAQGALVMGGTYLTYYWFTSVGVGLVPALLLNAAAGAIAGLTCEVVTVRTLRRGRRIRAPHAELITTVGMATVIAGAVGLAWGTDPLLVPFHGPSKPLHFLGVVAFPDEVILVGVAIVAATGCSLWFNRTRSGQASLALAEDREAAQLRGVNVERLSLLGFAAAGVLAGIAAFAVGPITYALPTLGPTLALYGFVAVALGGAGSFIGGLVGGMVVGLVSAFAARYIGANYADIAVLIVLLLTLGLRPRGLGGAVGERHV